MGPDFFAIEFTHRFYKKEQNCLGNFASSSRWRTAEYEQRKRWLKK